MISTSILATTKKLRELKLWVRPGLSDGGRNGCKLFFVSPALLLLFGKLWIQSEKKSCTTTECNCCNIDSLKSVLTSGTCGSGHAASFTIGIKKNVSKHMVPARWLASARLLDGVKICMFFYPRGVASFYTGK